MRLVLPKFRETRNFRRLPISRLPSDDTRQQKRPQLLKSHVCRFLSAATDVHGKETRKRVVGQGVARRFGPGMIRRNYVQRFTGAVIEESKQFATIRLKHLFPFQARWALISDYSPCLKTICCRT